jgi:hypothetical protein
MNQKRFRVVSAVALIPLAFVAWVVFQASLNWSGVRSACAEIKPGMTIEDAKRVFAKHQVLLAPHKKMTVPGVQISPSQYNWAIGVNATMGELACEVAHDGTKVNSAQMSGSGFVTK